MSLQSLSTSLRDNDLIEQHITKKNFLPSDYNNLQKPIGDTSNLQSNPQLLSILQAANSNAITLPTSSEAPSVEQIMANTVIQQATGTFADLASKSMSTGDYDWISLSVIGKKFSEASETEQAAIIKLVQEISRKEIQPSVRVVEARPKSELANGESAIPDTEGGAFLPEQGRHGMIFFNKDSVLRFAPETGPLPALQVAMEEMAEAFTDRFDKIWGGLAKSGSPVLPGDYGNRLARNALEQSNPAAERSFATPVTTPELFTESETDTGMVNLDGKLVKARFIANPDLTGIHFQYSTTRIAWLNAALGIIKQMRDQTLPAIRQTYQKAWRDLRNNTRFFNNGTAQTIEPQWNNIANALLQFDKAAVRAMDTFENWLNGTVKPRLDNIEGAAKGLHAQRGDNIARTLNKIDLVREAVRGAEPQLRQARAAKSEVGELIKLTNQGLLNTKRDQIEHTRREYQSRQFVHAVVDIGLGHVLPLALAPYVYIGQAAYNYFGRDALKGLGVPDKVIDVIDPLVAAGNLTKADALTIALALAADEVRNQLTTPVQVYEYLVKAVGQQAADAFLIAAATPIKLVMEPFFKFISPGIPKLYDAIEATVARAIGAYLSANDKPAGFRGMARATGGAITQVSINPPKTDQTYKPVIDDTGETLALVLNNPIVREALGTLGKLFGDGEYASQLEEALFTQVFGEGVSEEQKAQIRTLVSTMMRYVDGDEPITSEQAQQLMREMDFEFGHFGSAGYDLNAAARKTANGEYALYFGDHLLKVLRDHAEKFGADSGSLDVVSAAHANFIADLALEEVIGLFVHKTGTEGLKHSEVEGYEDGDIGERFLNFVTASNIFAGDDTRITIPDIQYVARANGASEPDTVVSPDFGGTISANRVYIHVGTKQALYIGFEVLPAGSFVEQFRTGVTATSQLAAKAGVWIPLTGAGYHADGQFQSEPPFINKDTTTDTEYSEGEFWNAVANAFTSGAATIQLQVKLGTSTKTKQDNPNFIKAKKNWNSLAGFVTMSHNGQSGQNRVYEVSLRGAKLQGTGFDVFQKSGKIAGRKTEHLNDLRRVTGAYVILAFQVLGGNYHGTGVGFGSYIFQDFRAVPSIKHDRETPVNEASFPWFHDPIGGRNVLPQSHTRTNGKNVKFILDLRSTYFGEVGVAFDSYTLDPDTRVATAD